jgi:hypothetical protein
MSKWFNADTYEQLTKEFVDVCTPDLDKDQPSAMFRLCMLTGPPEGVNPMDKDLVDLVLKAAAKWPGIETHKDWRRIAENIDLLDSNDG